MKHFKRRSLRMRCISREKTILTIKKMIFEELKKKMNASDLSTNEKREEKDNEIMKNEKKKKKKTYNSENIFVKFKSCICVEHVSKMNCTIDQKNDLLYVFLHYEILVYFRVDMKIIEFAVLRSK